MSTKTTPKKATNKKYESNPFKSSFDGMSRLFRLSQTAAIVVLVVSLFGMFFNGLGYIPFPFENDTNKDTSITTVEPQSTEGIDSYVENDAYYDFDSRSEQNDTSTNLDTGYTEETTDNDNKAFATFLIVFIGLIVSTLVLISIIIGALWTGTVSYIALQNSKNKEATISEAITMSFKKFWRILWLQLIIAVKVIFGFIFFIVPGIRAALRYQMAFMTMFDGDLKAREAIKRTKFLTKNHLMEVFGILTVSQILFPVAELIKIGGQSILYPQLKHIKDNDLPKPPTHWLNYIGFVIAAGFILLILMVVLFVAALLAA